MKLISIVVPVVTFFLQKYIAVLPTLQEFIAIRSIYLHKNGKMETEMLLQPESHLQYDEDRLGLRIGKQYMDDLLQGMGDPTEDFDAFYINNKEDKVNIGKSADLKVYAESVGGNFPDTERFQIQRSFNICKAHKQPNGTWCHGCKLLGNSVGPGSDDVARLTNFAEISRDPGFIQANYYLSGNKTQENPDFQLQPNPPAYYVFVLRR